MRGRRVRAGDEVRRAQAHHLVLRQPGRRLGSGGPDACDWWQDEVIVDASELDEHHTDVNGDGLADLCARAAAGLRCSLAVGDGTSVGPVVRIPKMAGGGLSGRHGRLAIPSRFLRAG